MAIMRFFTSDLRHNIIKMLCLTMGLSIGMLIVAKLYFQAAYDTSIPDYQRIYIATESVIIDGDYSEYTSTPGAIGPGLKQYLPQVEAATRITPFAAGDIRLDDGRYFASEGMKMADSSFFDVISTPILAGNPHDALEVASTCMIPRSLAEKIGGDVIGLRFCMPQLSEDYKVTIGGVYEDFGLNTSFDNCIYLSLSSMALMSHDGRGNWVGNDRYKTYVKLAQGTDPSDLKPHIRKMLEENVDEETLTRAHFDIGVTPLDGSYLADGATRMMMWTMGLLAAVMLLSAGFNFLMIVIGQMGRRAKEMAIRKCFGTSNAKIFTRVMGESLFFVAASMGLALLIAFTFSAQCNEILGFTPAELLTVRRVWLVEVAVGLLLLFIAGAIPAWMYCRTPVAAAFRSDIRSRRGWKMALLAVQFMACGALVSLLMLVGRQYLHIVSSDIGYRHENVGHLYLSGIPQETRRSLVNELRRLSCVEGVASADHDLLSNASGNNVWLGDNYMSTVNIADLYSANGNLFEVMDMEMLQGSSFPELSDSMNNVVVVESRFADMLHNHFGLSGENIVGQPFKITEHILADSSHEYIVGGVIANMMRGSIIDEYADKRPAVIFPSHDILPNLFVKFNALTPENLSEAQRVVDTMLPTHPAYIVALSAEVNNLYLPIKRFGLAVIIVGIAIIVITLIGLAGFTADEVQRRAKEIAMRKVTGTSARGIVSLLCRDTLKVALPSLLAGWAVAIAVGGRWLSQFTTRVSLSPLSMLLCILLLLMVTVAMVVAGSLRVARSNPVDYLHND
ncbi:MAG: ABC transporter permease [Pseudoflavonifractor sp.]|nr:ABC transporter permease [Alloprevotella sp.]MCM1116213.1 ABC transporter permease [Pseudoflavonifractor sp.]